MEQEENNINNEGQDPTEEKPDEGSAEGEGNDNDEGKDGEEEADKLPFHKHPRWQELQGKLSEAHSTNEQLIEDVTQLKSMIEKLSKAAPSEETDEIMAELEKMDENRPSSYKEMFAKFRELNKKVEAKEKADAEKVASEQQDKTIKALQKQLADLVELGDLKKEEIPEFANWCAEKLQKGESEDRYGNFHAALPHWQKAKADEAAAEKAKEDKKDRSGTPPSGGEPSDVVKVSMKELGEMSLLQAMKKSENSKDK